MNHPIVLYLPFPISVNAYYSKTRWGVRRSKRGNQFRNEAKEAIMEQTIPPAIDKRISMTVILYPPDSRHRDLDNYMKSLQDVMNKDDSESWKGVYEDDSLIDQLRQFRGEIVKGGKTVVIIEEAGPVLPNKDGIIDMILSGAI